MSSIRIFSPRGEGRNPGMLSVLSCSKSFSENSSASCCVMNPFLPTSATPFPWRPHRSTGLLSVIPAPSSQSPHSANTLIGILYQTAFNKDSVSPHYLSKILLSACYFQRSVFQNGYTVNCFSYFRFIKAGHIQ